MLLRVTKSTSYTKLLQELVTNSYCKCSTRQIATHSTRLVTGYSLGSLRKHLNSNCLTCHQLILPYSSVPNNTTINEQELSPVQFEKISDETLDSLTEYFDELIEEAVHLKDADVSYGNGVLTVKFGNSYGTYVINRQTPNKQIWLSSPKSGPKRYDFINGKWIYKHDGMTMHQLLNNEIPAITKSQVCFDKCAYSGKE